MVGSPSFDFPQCIPRLKRKLTAAVLTLFFCVEEPDSGREGRLPEQLGIAGQILLAEHQPAAAAAAYSNSSFPLVFEFKAPLPVELSEPAAVPTISITPPASANLIQQQEECIADCEFQPAQNFQFAASDFDFLLSKEGENNQIQFEPPRDSLLLKFDPLLKVPVVSRLSTTKEEESECVGGGGGVGGGVVEIAQLIETAPAAEEAEGFDCDIGGADGEGAVLSALEASGFIAVSPTPASPGNSSNNSSSSSAMNIEEAAKNLQPHCADEETDEKMNVDTTLVQQQEEATMYSDRTLRYSDMEQNVMMDCSTGNGSNSELDKKSKNESLKIEELQKKLGETEQREEQLVKRITEKDKIISKMSGVVEAYERAIAELIAEKEQTTQNYEKMCEALKADADVNAQHLDSLEKTFSDLHAKYERMKILTAESKEREEELTSERNRFKESLHMQEKRYEKMKTHAMTQLELANNKLSELVRNHAQEVTKLKALLKKEEIFRASVNEKLSQKARENEELVKICEELINGGTN